MNIDIEVIKNELMKVMMDVISGKQFPITVTNLNIKLPSYIINIAEVTAKAGNTTVEEVLAHMASQGITSFITSVQSQNQPKTGFNLDIPGMDMSKLTSGLSQIKSLTDTLERMQKDLDHGIIPDFQGKNP